MPQEIFYLDHAAATPMDQRVLDAMTPYFSDSFYNPSSPYAPAVEVRREYEAAKSRLAQTFGAKADELVMTAGATESIQLALRSFGGHMVCSSIEHEAVLDVARDRDSTLVSADSRGLVTPDAVVSAVRDDTEIVSIQLANNELGTIQPIRHIAQMIKRINDDRLNRGITTRVYLHCDASQGFGYLDVHTARLGVDLLTLNAAKIYGPKQVGLLWARSDVRLKPLNRGGGQERGLRSGTENVAGVMGFAAAAELSTKHQRSEADRLAALRNKLQAVLESHFTDMIVNGHQKKRLPNMLHVSFPGLDAERLVFGLEARGVLVATGSACAANKGTRSHVLTAIGMTDAEADGSLRISLGRDNDEPSLTTATNYIIEVIQNEYERLKK